MNTPQRLLPATVLDGGRDTRVAPPQHTLPAHPLQTASAANLSAALGPSAALAHRPADDRQPTAHRRSNVLHTTSDSPPPVLRCEHSGRRSPGPGPHAEV